MRQVHRQPTSTVGNRTTIMPVVGKAMHTDCTYQAMFERCANGLTDMTHSQLQVKDHEYCNRNSGAPCLLLCRTHPGQVFYLVGEVGLPLHHLLLLQRPLVIEVVDQHVCRRIKVQVVWSSRASLQEVRRTTHRAHDHSTSMWPQQLVINFI